MSCPVHGKQPVRFVELTGHVLGNLPLPGHALRSSIHSARFFWIQQIANGRLLTDTLVDWPLIGDHLQLNQNNDGAS